MHRHELPAVIGYKHLAAYLGMTVGAARRAHHDGRFPDADGVSGQSPVWMRETVLRAFPDGTLHRRERCDAGVPRGPRSRATAAA